MTEKEEIDLADVQGNVVRGYARFVFPKARYLVLEVKEQQGARKFLLATLEMITTGVHWSPNSGFPVPSATTNIAFTYRGLAALGVPEASLRTFPKDFADGMLARASILGDDGPSAPDKWDPVWRDPERVHIFLEINGRTEDDVKRRYDDLLRQMERFGGVELLQGHSEGSEDSPYQDGSALYDEKGRPTAKEHFGYTDGISNPYFRGSGSHPSNVVGGGKLIRKNPFSRELEGAPLEPGEFILGHRDESAQLPTAPMPQPLAHNGTFMVVRKLRQDVDAFKGHLDDAGAHFPGGKEALAAKYAGRWRNGAPLTKFPTQESADGIAEQWSEAKRAISESKTPEARDAAKERFSGLHKQFVDYNFNADIKGGRCPIGAHTRRVNPRGSLEFNQKGAFGTAGAFETPSALTDRRRILRRGLPYGGDGDNRDVGLVFMAINASIERQFEFVQQQWVNYGNDFRLANEKDPILGNHGTDDQGRPSGRMSVQGSDELGQDAHFCAHIPRFVFTRGGDYFFIPSITALRLIGQGTVDPT